MVVWKRDRLGRSLLHLLETVNGLQARGCFSQSVREYRHDHAGVSLFFTFLEHWQSLSEASFASAAKGGRRAVMDSKKIAMARAMLADSTNKVADIYTTLKVSKSTLYKYAGKVGR